jgi:orotate phosphoribosyltransferase
MESYKQNFIEFMVRAGVLTFGDFVTKSGRNTPYFVNTGLYRTGDHMRRLGEYYADAIEASIGTDYDVLFGPAYKGIPLVVTTAVALSARDRNVAFCFNRKEAKDHGEKGVLVGHQPRDGERVLIIEDVTTAGTSIRETVPILRHAASVQLAGLVVSADRKERGTGSDTALAEVGREFDMPTFAIVTVYEVIEHLSENDVDGKRILTADLKNKMLAYLSEYGTNTKTPAD